MMKRLKEKFSDKQLTKIAVIAIIAVLIILGGTYAWLRIGLGANNSNIIKAGALDLRIDESPTNGSTIRLERAIPQSYRQGITNPPYRFTLINNSTIDTDYTLTLEDLYEGADASLTEFDKISDNYIRYILVKNDDEMVATNSKLLSDGRTIDSGTIPGKVGNTPTEIPYTLYVWIDSQAGDYGTESDIMDKIFNARLNITAEQHHIVTVNVGDIVFYNPVEKQYCSGGEDEYDCYRWVVLNKNGNGEAQDLMFLEEDYSYSANGNPFSVFDNYVIWWNHDFEVDTQYDLDPIANQSFAGYRYDLARLPLSSEITSAVAKTLKDENIAIGTSADEYYENGYYNEILTMYDKSNYGVFYIEDDQNHSEVYGPYGSGATSTDNVNLYVHPVIRVTDSNTVATCSASNFRLGDYISMTPTETNYQVPSSLTGYDSNPELNPSELNVWRVIELHNNGTLDMVSDSVSSNSLMFDGVTGYKNYVRTLNEIASHYTNSKYTIGSRHMGYDGQTEVISDTSLFDGTYTPYRVISNTPNPTTGVGQEYSEISSGDGGDTLYLKDYQLVNNVYGTLHANRAGTTYPESYFLASRAVGNEGMSFYGRVINVALPDYIGPLHVYNLRHYSNYYKNTGWIDVGSDANGGESVRPIVVLKSGVTVSGGKGTKLKPYKLC